MVVAFRSCNLKDKKLIGTEGCSTPVGDAGRLRPHRSDSDEEAQLTPQGKRASWSGNQLTHTKIATMYMKTAFIKELPCMDML